MISPTCSKYTTDTPHANHGLSAVYTDNVTQIISYQRKSKQMMKSCTTREIKTLNVYDRRWKIKMNQNKFQQLYIAKKKKNPPEIDTDERLKVPMPWWQSSESHIETYFAVLNFFFFFTLYEQCFLNQHSL